MAHAKRTETWAWVLGIIAAMIVVGFIGSIWRDNEVIEQAVTNTSPLAGAPVPTVTGTNPSEDRVDFEIGESGDLATNTNQYVDATVTVEGVLNQSVSDGVFTVAGDSEELLVISRIQQLGDIEKGTQIRVIGTARRMSLTELSALETEVGYDLQDDLAKQYGNKLVIVADTVQALAH